MRAYEGYIENGQFFSIGTPMFTKGRQRVIITVLDTTPETETPEELSRNEYFTLLDELCGSIDDPTFLEPSEIPWEHNALREEIV